MHLISSTYCQNSVFRGKHHRNAVFARKHGLDYYPGGMLMPGRTYQANPLATPYRYGGAGGQERDDEIYGKGNSYTAEFWQYDSRLGRRWNLDPRPNPSISNYATFANNPVWFSDPLGDTVRNDGFSQRKILKDLRRGIETDKKNSPYYYDRFGDLQINQEKYDALPEDKRSIVDNVKGAIESDVVFTIRKSKSTDKIPGTDKTVGDYYNAVTVPNLGKNGFIDGSGKSGVTVYWGGHNERDDETGFVYERSSTLYHELGGHGVHRYHLKIERYEASTIAVDVENGVRACMGLPLRRFDTDHPPHIITTMPMRTISAIK